MSAPAAGQPSSP